MLQEVLRKEKVKLTPARAMLLSVLYELVRHGEFVSEFAAEKAAYFLQRFGGQDAFKLDFQPNFYGPYSGKVKHVLHYLNSSYIKGYGSKDKKPFQEIEVIPSAEVDINNFLNRPENLNYKTIAEKTKEFLSGFYSSFALELLSTVDFIMQKEKVDTHDAILNELNKWSNRKKTLFTNAKFIDIALKNLKQYLPL